MLIDCKDKILIDYIDNTLDSLGIDYYKTYHCKYLILEYEPFYNKGYKVNWEVKSFKELHYINKITKEFIAKREYLERCLCLK